MLTPADWAGLCALTETNRPEEQEYVLWVIRNRVESPRFPDTYEEVILQPKQFSAFNEWHDLTPDRAFDALARRAICRHVLAAVHLAEEVLRQKDADLNGFAPLLMPKGEAFDVAWAQARKSAHAVLHYYSPVSMKPAGSAPAWAKSAKRLFTPSGIDPQRFVFAEGVP